MNNTEVKVVTKHKHLGIVFQQDAKWSEHIKEISLKAKRRIDILCSLKYILDGYSLLTLYKCYIRPLLEYGCMVWLNITETEKHKLEDIQTKAARLILGVKKRDQSKCLEIRVRNN